MRELEADKKIVVAAVRLDVAGPRDLNQARESGQILFVDQELAGIGSSLRHNRAGLAPDKLGTAGTKATVTADRQLAR